MRSDQSGYEVSVPLASQPIPEVSPEDVERVVQRDYVVPEVAAARLQLERYGTESWQRAADRVRLAALKLAAGDLRRLETAIDTACADYRDVIGPAEYPRYLAQSVQDLDDTRKQQIFDADWDEYQQWLKA